MEQYLAIKKKEILPFITTWMDLEGIMLSEISKTEKDKYHTISLICGILKMKQTNHQTEKKKTHTQIKRKTGD